MTLAGEYPEIAERLCVVMTGARSESDIFQLGRKKPKAEKMIKALWF
jgi:hypothetical protein